MENVIVYWNINKFKIYIKHQNKIYYFFRNGNLKQYYVQKKMINFI